jgi:hypothetical protein
LKIPWCLYLFTSCCGFLALNVSVRSLKLPDARNRIAP